MRSIAGPLTKMIIFTVVTVIATALVAATIATINFRSTAGYKARFTDVAGLLVGDDVRIAGVPVGKVTSIDVVDRRLAEVGFTVDSDRPLPASTNLTVRYRNLVGQRYLAVEQGPGPVGATLKPGAVIPLQQTHPALNLTVLFNGFKPLLVALSPDEVNQLSYEIIQVLQGEGGTIDDLLAHTASLTSSIADRDQVIGSLITNLNSVLDTVNQRDAQLSALVVALQQLVSGLASDRAAIGSAISSIGDLAGATSSLLADARPPLRGDITALGTVSTTLDDNRALVENFLGNLPVKLETLGRTASYGSWFNFYLCDLTGGFSVGGTPVNLPTIQTNEPRCAP